MSSAVGQDGGAAGGREGRNGEQSPERLMGVGDRLLELFAREDEPALRL